MSAPKQKQEKDERVLADSDVRHEDVSLVQDWSLAVGEQELEARVNAIHSQIEAAASSHGPDTHLPQAVDYFLRNFLLQMSMTETLDCFQTEYTEMVQRAPVVPEVHVENQRLHSELRDAQREREENRLAASAGAKTLARVQKERDFHRLQHERVVQEKNRVIEDIRKLKSQCSHYDPALKRMDEKYQAALKQTELATLKRDKALMQGKSRAPLPNIPVCGEAGEEEAGNRAAEPSVKGTRVQ